MPDQSQTVNVNVKMQTSSDVAAASGQNFYDAVKTRLKAQEDAKARAEQEQSRAAQADAERQRIASIDRAAGERRKAQDEERRARDERTARTTHFIGAAGGGGVRGALGAIGGRAGLVGVAMDAAGQVMDRVSKAAEIFNDSFQTSAQKTRALASEFVPLADKVIRLGDALDGTTDKIARQEMKYRVLAARENSRAEGEARERAARAELTQAKFTSRATALFHYGQMETFDRSTVLGERAYAEQGVMQPLLDARTRAEREAVAARAFAARTPGGLAAAERLVRAKQDQLARAQGEEQSVKAYENRGFRDKTRRDEALRSVSQADVELANAMKQKEEEINRVKQSNLQLAQAESNLRKANIEVERAELSILEQREHRASGTAQRFGSMNRGERIHALQALKLVSQMGIENAPSELQAAAAGIAPEYVGKLREKFGESAIKNEAMGFLGKDKFNEIFGGDFDKALREQREQIDRVRASIRVDIQLDEEQVAAALARELGPILANLIKMTKFNIEKAERDIRTGAAISSNLKN